MNYKGRSYFYSERCDTNCVWVSRQQPTLQLCGRHEAALPCSPALTPTPRSSPHTEQGSVPLVRPRFRCQLHVRSWVSRSSARWTTDLEVLRMPSSALIICQNNSQNSGKRFTYNQWLIERLPVRNSHVEELQRARRGSRRTQLPCSLRACPFLAYPCVQQLRSPLNPTLKRCLEVIK